MMWMMLQHLHLNLNADDDDDVSPAFSNIRLNCIIHRMLFSANMDKLDSTHFLLGVVCQGQPPPACNIVT